METRRRRRRSRACCNWPVSRSRLPPTLTGRPAGSRPANSSWSSPPGRNLRSLSSAAPKKARGLPTGERHFVEVLKAPVYNAAGAVTGVQIAFWDVTARKRAEEELSESESRNRAVLQAALDCIVTIDQDGKIIEFNPAAEA